MTSVTFAWASSDNAKASVSAAGLVTVLDTGSVRITASAAGESDTAGFTLAFVPVASISLTPVGDTAMPGESMSVEATARSGAGQALTDRDFAFGFSSSNEAVATVGSDGTVTAISPGTATITATYETFSATTNLLVPACTTKVVVNENAWSAPIVFGGIAPGVSLTLPGTTWGGTGVLYAAGLVVGTGAGNTLIGEPATHYGASAGSLPLGQVCVLNNATWSGNSRTFARVTLHDSDGGVPGLQVTQETFASPDQDDVLLVRYTLRNTTGLLMHGLRVGMFTDWDVLFDASATDDVLLKTATADASEVHEQVEATYPSIVGLRTIGTGTFSYLGWLGDDDASFSDFYGVLAAGTVSTAVMTGDVRHLLGRGPFSLGPGGEVKVSFALVGGGNRTLFTSALAAAATLSTSLAGQ
jgi:hypothetical protein